MEELEKELQTIDEFLYLLSLRREEVLDILYPEQEDDSWMDRLAEEYAKIA